MPFSDTSCVHVPHVKQSKKWFGYFSAQFSHCGYFCATFAATDRAKKQSLSPWKTFSIFSAKKSQLFDIIRRINVAREMNIIFERKTVTWSMRSLAKSYSSLTHYLEHTRETHKLAARHSTFMGRKWMSLKRLAIDQSISETVRSLWKIWNVKWMLCSHFYLAK